MNTKGLFKYELTLLFCHFWHPFLLIWVWQLIRSPPSILDSQSPPKNCRNARIPPSPRKNNKSKELSNPIVKKLWSKEPKLTLNHLNTPLLPSFLFEGNVFPSSQNPPPFYISILQIKYSYQIVSWNCCQSTPPPSRRAPVDIWMTPKATNIDQTPAVCVRFRNT